MINIVILNFSLKGVGYVKLKHKYFPSNRGDFVTSPLVVQRVKCTDILILKLVQEMGHGLNGQGIWARFPARGGDFSVLRNRYMNSCTNILLLFICRN